ncbi:MAG TPA: hypothetical protein VFM18_18630 [Methanosarcina sp.]|nr:hypothetical protein [Methanosarcina sp.]
MFDHLKDIIEHTQKIGVINMLKVTGTPTSTTINAYDQDTKTVVLSAEFKAPIAEFLGVFGMPNLDRLNTILNIPEYREDAKITVAKQKDQDGEDIPSSINFENKGGDFKNSYRFMSTAVINDQLKNVKMKPVKWGVEIEPTAASIQKLRFQSSAHSDAPTFSTKTEGGALKLYFGDAASHAGNFTFADTGGSLSKQLHWPVNVIISILSLPGDKEMKISDDGVMQITVDSGLAVYNYQLPAQTK